MLSYAFVIALACRFMHRYGAPPMMLHTLASRLMIALTALLLALCCGTSATAQVRVSLEPEHNSAILHEVIVLKLTISNDTDIPLVFSKTYSTSSLRLRIRKSSANPSLGDICNLERELVVMPGKSKTELIEAGELYDFKQPGSYRLRAEVDYGDVRFKSREKIIDVVPGVEIARAIRPLPGYVDTGITYTLRYWTRNRTEYLFLCAEDRMRSVWYGTFQLGQIVRFRDPEFTFDSNKVLHIMHQSGRARLTKSTFHVSESGINFVAQTHWLPDGRPYPTRGPVEFIRKLPGDDDDTTLPPSPDRDSRLGR